MKKNKNRHAASIGSVFELKIEDHMFVLEVQEIHHHSVEVNIKDKRFDDYTMKISENQIFTMLYFGDNISVQLLCVQDAMAFLKIVGDGLIVTRQSHVKPRLLKSGVMLVSIFFG